MLSKVNEQSGLSRRQLLKGLAVATGAAAVAACAPPAATAPAGGDSDGGMTERSRVRCSNFIAVMKPQAELYNEINENYIVDFEVAPWGEMYERILLDVAAGTPPDCMVFTGPWWYGLMIQKVTHPLNDLLQQADADGTIDLDLYVVPPEKVGGYDGEIWGTAYNPPNLRAIWHNIELFDEAGADHPTDDWTWDDLTEALLKVSDPPNRFGMTPVFLWLWQEMIWSNGGELVSPDFTTCHLDMPESIQAIQQAADWALEHEVVLMPADRGLLGDNVFGSGKLGCVMHAFSDWDTHLVWTNNDEFPIDLHYFPTSPNTGKRAHSGEVHIAAMFDGNNFDGGWDYFLWSTTSEDALGIQMLDVGINCAYNQDYYIEQMTGARREWYARARQYEGIMDDIRLDWVGPKSQEIWNLFNASIDSIYLQEKTVEESMVDVTAEINAVIAEG